MSIVVTRDLRRLMRKKITLYYNEGSEGNLGSPPIIHHLNNYILPN